MSDLPRIRRHVWGTMLSLGLVVAAMLALVRAAQCVAPNMAYLQLLRSSLSDDQRLLETAANRLSSSVASQPVPRRMWDESLLWFRLGRYDRGAAALPAIEPENLDPLYRVKGMQPYWPLVYSVFSEGGRDPVDWQWIVGNRPPAEYLVLRGVLAAQRGEWNEALRLYRLALVVAPQVFDSVFYQQYYQALAHSTDPLDIRVAGSIQRVLSGDSDIDKGVLVMDQEAILDAPEHPVSPIGEGCEDLVSFGYDEAALSRGPLVPMRFVWACSAGEDGGSSSQLESQIQVQQVLAVNLIPNSGFEWSRRDEGKYPLGHERSFYHYDNSEHRFLTLEKRNGVLQNVASIQRAPPTNEASFVPAPIGVAAGACYLHATWAKSLQGNGQMAVRWRGLRITDLLTGDYLGISPSEGWQLMAQVVRAPSDAAYVDAFVGYQGTTVPHFFDNHLLVILPPAPCAEEEARDG